jgi:hypothetical protein
MGLVCKIEQRSLDTEPKLQQQTSKPSDRGVQQADFGCLRDAFITIDHTFATLDPFRGLDIPISVTGFRI